MDINKLPRLSETARHAEAPPPQQHPPDEVPRQPMERVAPGIGAEVWISLIIGVILMMVGQSFARYAIARLSGNEFHTRVNWTSGPKAGQEVDYWDLQGYTAWTDTAIFLFGLAMVLEAAMLAVVYSRSGGKIPLTMLALIVTILATALNLWVCFLLFGAGILPLMSGLAVAFGGYIAMYEWRLLHRLRAFRHG